MKTFKLPKHFDASKKDQVFRVDYTSLAQDAKLYKQSEGISNAATDKFKIALMNIDVQNTFCMPDFELPVQGAVEDSLRLTEFIYKNIGRITKVFNTLDTHTDMQIFHPSFFLDKQGNTPTPMTNISLSDIQNGTWRVNPGVASNYSVSYPELSNHVIHYCEELKKKGKYDLTIWPYHAMLGGIGHAMVSIVEEASFFHGQIRNLQSKFEVKGGNPLTENYSVLSPEVVTSPDPKSAMKKALKAIAHKNRQFIEKLLKYDMLIIAGQAKSHCVAWTIDDLLNEIVSKDPSLAKKVYLLEDCTSPVIVPGIVDYTDDANKAFERFKQAGMNVVRSTDTIDTWPGVDLNKLT